MDFAIVPPVVQARHAKRPTQKSRQEQTEITDDGQVVGYKTDTIYYTEMDEE